MATWNDVRRIALALPGTAEQSSRGIPAWRVKDKGFIWERPLRRTDVEALGRGQRLVDEGASGRVPKHDVGEGAANIDGKGIMSHTGHVLPTT